MQHFLSIFLIRISSWFTATQIVNNSFFLLICMLLLFEFSHCDSFVSLLNSTEIELKILIRTWETCSTPERVQYWLESECLRWERISTRICIINLCLAVSLVITLSLSWARMLLRQSLSNTRKIHGFFVSRLLSIANLWTWNNSID